MTLNFGRLIGRDRRLLFHAAMICLVLLTLIACSQTGSSAGDFRPANNMAPETTGRPREIAPEPTVRSMSGKELIEKLGFSKDDKVVLMHIDDVACCHASVAAAFECFDFGTASTGSVITTSDWTTEVGWICSEAPEGKYDLGVHLTLTATSGRMRWGPLSTVGPASGLMDKEGVLWKNSRQAAENVSPEAAEREFRAQIRRALNNGIDVTHIDLHSGIERSPEILAVCHRLGKEFRVPAFAYGDPIFDHVINDTRMYRRAGADWLINQLRSIEPGLTFVHSHAARGGPELEAYCGPASARWRNAGYEALMSPQVKEAIAELDLKLIGYRQIRDHMRAHPGEFWPGLQPEPVPLEDAEGVAVDHASAEAR